MILQAQFEESAYTVQASLEGATIVSGGDYEQGYTNGYQDGEASGRATGYAEGYEVGNTEGYDKGYAEGLAERKYETWEITLTDGTVIEKDVALL